MSVIRPMSNRILVSGIFAALMLTTLVAFGPGNATASRSFAQDVVTERLEALRKQLPPGAKYTVGPSTAFRLLAKAEKDFMEGDLKAAAALNVSPAAVQKRAFNFAIRRLANTRIPANFLELGKARRARVGAPSALGVEAGADPTAKAFDWRSKGRVTPVRTYLDNTGQDSCGCCWDFAAVAVIESSVIKNHQGEAATLDASEQDILNQGNNGGCDGDWYQTAFTIMENDGTATEQAVPYTAVPVVPNPNPAVARPYRVVDFGLVNDAVAIPDKADIKRSLCQFGPLAVAVMADDGFVAYSGGVYVGFPSTNVSNAQINHAVTLIGWDDTKGPNGAWLIKNSWGNDWGETGGRGSEKGYIWIDYQSNNVGFAAAWARAKTDAPAGP
jgi:C1A family cysteine protease